MATRKPKKTTTKAKTSKKSAKTSSKSQGEMLLVGSKTKEALKVHGVNVASDALEGLNAWVHWLIEQSAKRAAANGRKTVRAHDFIVYP